MGVNCVFYCCFNGDCLKCVGRSQLLLRIYHLHCALRYYSVACQPISDNMEHLMSPHLSICLFIFFLSISE